MEKFMWDLLNVDYDEYKELHIQNKREIWDTIYEFLADNAVLESVKGSKIITISELYLIVKQHALDQELYELLSIFRDFEQYYAEKLNI